MKALFFSLGLTLSLSSCIGYIPRQGDTINSISSKEGSSWPYSLPKHSEILPPNNFKVFVNGQFHEFATKNYNFSQFSEAYQLLRKKNSESIQLTESKIQKIQFDVLVNRNYSAANYMLSVITLSIVPFFVTESIEIKATGILEDRRKISKTGKSEVKLISGIVLVFAAPFFPQSEARTKAMKSAIMQALIALNNEI